MIVATVDFCRAQPIAAANEQAVLRFANARSRRRQRRAHRAEPVAFLDAQTRRAADAALALRRRHRHSQSRNDVGNLRTIRVKPMQFRCAGDQLIALPPDVRAHVAQNVQNARAGRVHADILDGQLTARYDSARNEEERR